MFHFKQFGVKQSDSPLKIGTDACLLGAWAAGGKRILDIGCGTGIIALMMAQRFPDAEITAVEIQHTAAKEAEFNFKRSPWAHRLNVVHCDLLSWHPENTFDAIVCNPPYFADAVLSGNRAKDTARHSTTLDIEELLNWSKNHLNSSGKLSIVFPATDNRLPIGAFNAGLQASRCLDVRTRADQPPVRALWEFTPGNTEFFRSELSLEHTTRHVYTLEYWSLLKDFFLDF